MSNPEPESQSCWECDHAKVLSLPDGKKYVDCPPSNWKVLACVAKLLATFAHTDG